MRTTLGLMAALLASAALAPGVLAQKRGSEGATSCHVAPDVAQARADGATTDSTPHPIERAQFGGETACREEVVSVLQGKPRIYRAGYEFGEIQGMRYVIARQRTEQGNEVRVYLGPDAVPDFTNTGNVVLGRGEAACFAPFSSTIPFSCHVDWGGQSNFRTITKIRPGQPPEVTLESSSIFSSGHRAGAVSVMGQSIDIPYVPTGVPMYPYRGILEGPMSARVTDAALRAGRASVAYRNDDDVEVEEDLDLTEMRVATAMIRQIAAAMLAGST